MSLLRLLLKRTEDTEYLFVVLIKNVAKRVLQNSGNQDSSFSQPNTFLNLGAPHGARSSFICFELLLRPGSRHAYLSIYEVIKVGGSRLRHFS